MGHLEKMKVLILGGYMHMVSVVETAQKMGLYTIVVDRDAGSPAKAVADQSYDVSTDDLERLVEIAKSEGINGVFNGFDDINTWHALALCEKLDLPFYATREQLAICSDKEHFKQHCRNYGIPVIEEYAITSEEDFKRLTYPVIIKPVDSYASQGITVCYSPEEMKEGCVKAAAYSKNDKVIIERFIDNSYGVMMFYTVKNGEITLSAMTDRHVHKQYKEHPPLPTATVFPSRHLDHYLETLDARVRIMLQGMDIQNGVLFIQSLYEDGEYFFYEMGFRLSGTQYYTIVEKQTGINLLEMALDFAVGRDLTQYAVKEFDNGYTKFPACNLSILLDHGTIKEVIGLERILLHPAIVSYVPVNGVGDRVEMTGTYAQMLGRFNIVAQNKEEFIRIIEDINDTLHVVSSNGSEMIIIKYIPSEKEPLLPF